MRLTTFLRPAAVAVTLLASTTTATAGEVAIRCTVVDGAGQPVDEAEVALQFVHRLHPVVRDEDRLLEQRTLQTDAQGRCQAEVVAIPADVDPLWLQCQVARDGYADARVSVRLSGGRLAGSPPVPVRIELKPGRMVTGCVVDSQGRPIEAAEVFAAVGVPAFDCSPRRTDGHGEFHLWIPEDATRLVAVAHAAGHAPRRETIFVDAPGPHRIMLPPGTRVSGRLLDVGGQPLVGYHVLARATGTGHPVVSVIARTSPDGRFDLGPLHGEFILSVPRHVRRWSTAVHEQAPEPPAIIKPRSVSAVGPKAMEIALHCGTPATLSGRITDERGNPIAGHVVAILANVANPGAESLLEYAITDADGRYRSRCVPLDAESVQVAPVGILPLDGGRFLRANAAAHVPSALPAGDAVRFERVISDIADIDFQYLPWTPAKGVLTP